MTRTPTQVASHAQKYFIRQLSGSKDKRRASIHDITTVNLSETTNNSSEDTNISTSPQHSMLLSHQHQQQQPNFQWNNQPNAGGALDFNPAHEKVFMSPHGVNSYGLNMQGQNLHKG